MFSLVCRFVEIAPNRLAMSEEFARHDTGASERATLFGRIIDKRAGGASEPGHHGRLPTVLGSCRGAGERGGRAAHNGHQMPSKNVIFSFSRPFSFSAEMPMGVRGWSAAPRPDFLLG